MDAALEQLRNHRFHLPIAHQRIAAYQRYMQRTSVIGDLEDPLNQLVALESLSCRSVTPPPRWLSSYA
jgi:hypothetical protein